MAPRKKSQSITIDAVSVSRIRSSARNSNHKKQANVSVETNCEIVRSQLKHLDDEDFHEKNGQLINEETSDDDVDEEMVDDWEEVEEIEMFDTDSYNPTIPETVKIKIDRNAQRTKSNHIHKIVRARINQFRKQIQLNSHRIHLLLLIHRLKFLNSIIREDFLKALALSRTSNTLEKKLNIAFLKKFLRWIKENFTVSLRKNSRSKSIENDDIQQQLISSFQTSRISSILILNLILIVFLRNFSLKVRLCYLLSLVPIKATNLLNKKSNLRAEESDNPKVKPKILDEHCYWLEVLIDQQHWISVDPLNELIDEPLMITAKRKRQHKQCSYVLAIDNEDYIKDVTQRYASNWFTYDRIKNRIEGEWLESTYNLVRGPIDSVEEKADRREFEANKNNAELPTRRCDYKNHPLFVLRQDFHKNQALYPRKTSPIGYFDDEPIYSRDNLHTLRTKHEWLRKGRQLRVDEKPYDQMLSKFKRTKFDTEKLLNLYGFWQTEEYKPPAAQNGVVPRNRYGSVYLFQESMLPKGTVWLQMPNLDRIASEMKIDCAPALIGYRNNSMNGTHEIKNGFVVCEEYQEILVEAWSRYQKNESKRLENIRQQRIHSNWRRLIRGLIIRHNLKIKYNI